MELETTLCRVCLNRTTAISLFDTVDDIQYSTKLSKCAQINISENDGLPHYICECCVNELTTSYEFILKCEVADKTLRYLKYQEAASKDKHPKDEFKNEQCQETEIDFVLEIKEEFDAKCDNLLDSNCDNNIICENISEIDCNEESSTVKGEIYCNDEFSTVKGHDENKCVRKTKRNKRNHHRTKIGPLKCEQCGLLTMSPSALATHMRTHTGEKPYTCNSCESQFRTKGSLKRHFEAKHSGKRERQFTCEICGSSFYRKNDIIIHMRLHTNEKPHVCPYCPKRFSQIASLIRHKRVHTGEKPFSCQICGKKFNDKALVKKHQFVHSNERNFTCLICNKSYKFKTALKAHLSLHSNETCKVCTLCGKSFSVQGNLTLHLRVAHSEKSGHCNICFKSFSDIETHMYKHTGLKPFMCKLCDKSFSAPRSLSHHMSVKHKNVAKFKCSVAECDKTFPTDNMLQYHLFKYHNKNGAPYLCQHCSRGFFRSSDLTRHVKISHSMDQTKVAL